MTPVEILPTICEMAITIAGFTAIVVSIRATRAGGWNVEERIRILGTLMVCGVAAVCAALPFGIAGFTDDEKLQFGLPLFVSGATVLVITSTVLSAVLKRQFEFLIPWITVTMMMLISALSALSVISSFGVLLPYSPGLLVLQLLGMLVASSITIVVTLAITYRRVSVDDPKE